MPGRRGPVGAGGVDAEPARRPAPSPVRGAGTALRVRAGRWPERFGRRFPARPVLAMMRPFVIPGAAMNQAAMQDVGRLLLRLAVGVLILLHGLSKLRTGLDGIEGLLEARGLPGALAYLVLVGEIVAPLMLIIGLHARIGGVIVAINMLVAIFLVHMGELGRLNGSGGWAIELQVMFLVGAVAVALLGPGRFSANQR